MFDLKDAQMNNVQPEIQFIIHLLAVYLLIRELHDHVPLVLGNLLNVSILLDDLVGENFLQKDAVLRKDIDFVFCDVVAQYTRKTRLIIFHARTLPHRSHRIQSHRLGQKRLTSNVIILQPVLDLLLPMVVFLLLNRWLDRRVHISCVFVMFFQVNLTVVKIWQD